MKGNTKPVYKSVPEGPPFKERRNIAKPMPGQAKAPTKGKQG